MARHWLWFIVLFLAGNFASVRADWDGNGPSIVSEPGDRAIIPGWHIISSEKRDADAKTISVPGYETSEWYRVSSRGTVFAGLLENHVFDDTELFFSDNLPGAVDYSAFQVPWFYRQEFSVAVQPDQRYFLQTHGITSRAQIHLNGGLVASEDIQVGSYGGLKYDVTDKIQEGKNALLITAYPTNYLRDFAMGFIDWNPYPPDNGTGVWRNIEVLQTGTVSLSAPRVQTKFDFAAQDTANVEIITDVANYGESIVDAVIDVTIQSDDESPPVLGSKRISLQPGEEKTLSIEALIDNPRIWWPATWGAQPLYEVTGKVTVDEKVSDVAEPRTFGIRHVSSSVNEHNDTQFQINGQPFLVLGAGYTSDMFYRFDIKRLKTQFQLVLDMGLNTVRLEGKQEHPELYDLADSMGLMILTGWECCNKWEGWSYNNDAAGEKWVDADYSTANKSMLHEAAMMQTHPSLLGFLAGSDFWPDDRATRVYVDALERYNWDVPVLASASKRGYPELLGPSGMKMEGPYDWVPPNYWYTDQLGAAFGFGSELGAGVGTPERASLEKFLSESDLEDLWTKPDKGLYHMSTNVSSFYTRKIYNDALYARYGAPTSLDDYLTKAKVTDYEATRAEFEAYAVRKNAERPSTGLIYWMLNAAWPSLHWQLFDYYLKPVASYYGTKVATRLDHVAYDYQDSSIWVISHGLEVTGMRKVTFDLIDLRGEVLAHNTVSIDAAPNQAQQAGTVPSLEKIKDVAFLRLILQDDADNVLSRNVYWISPKNDVLSWDESTWYYTPVTEFSNLKALFNMDKATIELSAAGPDRVSLKNTANVPAFFVQLSLTDEQAQDVTSAVWTDNHVTLFPGEEFSLGVKWSQTGEVAVSAAGPNVETVKIQL